MLTAKSNRQTKIKALRYGIDDYLSKPFDEEELSVRIKNLLMHRAARESFATENTSTASGQVAKVSQADQEWLTELELLAAENLGEPAFGVSSIAQHFALSESSLLRRLKVLIGMTPKQYLREVRLNRASEFLHAGRYRTVAEVAYQVGFRDATAFSRSFKRRFGKVPTEVG